jgi:hypothetical protein
MQFKAAIRDTTKTKTRHKPDPINL